MALSEEQLETVKTRWTVDGDSAGQIAGSLGVTRNVIMGVIHRRGWLQPGSGLPRETRVLKAPPPRVLKPKPAPPPPKVELVLDPAAFVALDQLGPHHCRYPVGEEGKYCGLMPNGSPYCDGHARIVYQPQQPRKIKRPR